MTTQPVPDVDAADVERIVARDFPASSAPGVQQILAAYGSESGQRDAERVRLAALKLADGDIARLKDAIAAALRDYRDILAAAEYPSYMHLAGGADERAREAAIEADFRQYDDWLRRSGDRGARMDRDGAREFALSLPGATEEPHFHFTSFRIGGKIFATMPPANPLLHVFVPEAEREASIAAYPDSCEVLHWGKRVVGVKVDLNRASVHLVRELLLAAHRAKAKAKR